MQLYQQEEINLAAEEIEELIEKAIDGSKLAYVELIRYYIKDMYKMARSKLGNKEEDIEDAIEDAIASSYEGIYKLRQVSSFKSWILKIVVNKCNDILKKNKEKNEISLDDSECENYISHDNVMKSDLEYNHLMKGLSEEEKTIVVFCKIHKYTSLEVSKIMNINDSTVRTKLSRAVQKLRKNYEEDFKRWMK